MMRSRFEKQLQDLNNDLITMGSMIEHAIDLATTALIKLDPVMAQEAIDCDTDINEMEKQIESLCLKLILHQQPVASDLRMISTALKMITDMERIGDHAQDISEITIKLCEMKYDRNLVHIPLMAKATIKMVSESIDAYVKKDLDLAYQVIEHDDIVDELFYTVKNDLIDLIHEDVDQGKQAIEYLMIAKYFERIGDHAVNIAEWVIFSITGQHKNTRII